MPIELENFRKHLTYTVKSSVQDILDDLKSLAELDIEAEKKQKEYGKKSLFCFLGFLSSFVLIFIIALLNINAEIAGLIALILSLVSAALLIVSIYMLIMRFKFKHLNLRNCRYELAKQVIQMLHRDMQPADLLNVNLSFQKTEKSEHKRGTVDHPYKSGWKIDSFQKEWLLIQGKFLDKTYFELSLTEVVKKQYGWKRGSSGKSKYKSKSKPVGLDISLRLTYPQRRYGAVKILQNQVNQAIQLPQSSTMRRLRVTDELILINARMNPDLLDNSQEIYQIIAAMFLSCYQVLNLAKMMTK